MIITVSGWRGSGKDTVAEYLIKNYGFKRVAFADILKDMVAEQYDIERSWLDDRVKKELPLYRYPVNATDKFSEAIHEMLKAEFKPGYDGKLYWTPRAIAILEGSIKRSVNANYWVQRAVEDTDRGGLYVISDARYKNEIEQLRLNAPGEIVSVRVERFETINTNDPSERDLDDYSFNYTINNKESEGKTLQDLYKQVDEIISAEKYRAELGENLG